MTTYDDITLEPIPPTLEPGEEELVFGRLVWRVMFCKAKIDENGGLCRRQKDICWSDTNKISVNQTQGQSALTLCHYVQRPLCAKNVQQRADYGTNRALWFQGPQPGLNKGDIPCKVER